MNTLIDFGLQNWLPIWMLCSIICVVFLVVSDPKSWREFTVRQLFYGVCLVSIPPFMVIILGAALIVTLMTVYNALSSRNWLDWLDAKPFRKN
jgi:hypothetical protein